MGLTAIFTLAGGACPYFKLRCLMTFRLPLPCCYHHHWSWAREERQTYLSPARTYLKLLM